VKIYIAALRYKTAATINSHKNYTNAAKTTLCQFMDASFPCHKFSMNGDTFSRSRIIRPQWGPGVKPQ